ncbi:hypothetical protein BHM03_00011812 [Ensete ventricosum]|uniref:Uncharacterized protein n=1 Tax=Ensete ventricosum TaxID=4639 RepID=A0A445MDC5_ENSVE|nr:hypothetical protein BHM03_00011812 [Ensete ventricosum]
MSPFPHIWRKISVRFDLRGVVSGRDRLRSDPSTLLLDGPEVDPWDCSGSGALLLLTFFRQSKSQPKCNVGAGRIASSATRLGKRLERQSCDISPPSSVKCWGRSETWDDDQSERLTMCASSPPWDRRVPLAERPRPSCWRSAEPLQRSSQGHVIALVPIALPATRCQVFCRPVDPSHLFCRVASALPRRTRSAMPSGALLHRVLSVVRCVADRSGPEVSRWTLPRFDRHPTYV